MKLVAPSNIPSDEEMLLLKAPIVVTLEVSQPPISWLKLIASLNIPNITITLEVFQAVISWLKLVAPKNIYLISVTCDTSQRLKSPLKGVF